MAADFIWNRGPGKRRVISKSREPRRADRREKTDEVFELFTSRPEWDIFTVQISSTTICYPSI